MSDGTYSQDFNSLASSGTANTWTDNVTLPGWYASQSKSPFTVPTYNVGTGSGTAGGLYSFGDSGSTERALGSVASGTPGDFAYGVRFTNNTASAQTNFTISCTGEQWRVANATAQKLAFFYQVGALLTNADAANAQSWTAFPALDFNSPNTNATQTLKGNDPTNQIVFTNVILSGVSVQPGQEIFFRWFDPDDPGSDDGLALDNLTIAFSPTALDTNPQPPMGHSALTLLTYNVAGNGTTDWSTNAPQVQAIGRQMQYLQPDIITFQEIPYTNTWQMANFVAAFLPGYALATNSGTDGYIRSAILSRFPITRSSKWLDGAQLDPFGYTNSNFTRDLFEAQISVPGFDQPLHVFTTHLKSTSGTSYADAAAKRAAEAAAITNFFATNLFVLYPNDPCVLTGDMNDSDTNSLAIQRLISAPTGLRLTDPTNPVTGSINTYSIRGSLNERIDFIFPGGLLFSNIASRQVFRTDLLTPLPPELNTDDDSVASDHLPVLMVFSNPYNTPFRLLSINASNQVVTLIWESANGRQYRVDASPDLAAWTMLATNLKATGTNFTFSTNVADAIQFFRIYRVP